MAEAKEQETRAQALARHMTGGTVEWGRNPLDTRSLTPGQGDVEPPPYKPFPSDRA